MLCLNQNFGINKKGNVMKFYLKKILFVSIFCTPSFCVGYDFQASLPKGKDLNLYDLSNAWSEQEFKRTSNSNTSDSISNKFEKHIVKTIDGIDLQSFTIENKVIKDDKHGFIIYFNAEDMKAEDNAQWAKELVEKSERNIQLTLFNYRCAGSSECGPLSYDNLVLDGIAQVERVLKISQYEFSSREIPNILLHGKSLGGAIATSVAHYFMRNGISLRLINDNGPIQINAKIESLGWKNVKTRISEVLYNDTDSIKNCFALKEWLELDPRVITFVYSQKMHLPNFELFSFARPDGGSLWSGLRLGDKVHGHIAYGSIHSEFLANSEKIDVALEKRYFSFSSCYRIFMESESDFISNRYGKSSEEYTTYFFFTEMLGPFRPESMSRDREYKIQAFTDDYRGGVYRRLRQIKTVIAFDFESSKGRYPILSYLLFEREESLNRQLDLKNYRRENKELSNIKVAVAGAAILATAYILKDFIKDAFQYGISNETK